MTQTYLGDNIYTLRKEKGLSQDEFAEKLGVSRQAVSKWERNEAYPDTENLIVISRFFNVSIDDLINKPLTGNDSSEKSSTKIKIDILGFSRDDDDEDDDDDDDDGDDDDDKISSPGKSLYSLWYNLPYPIIITAIYLLWGCFTDDGWAIGWTLFVTIPVYYTVIDVIRKKRLTCFAYPVFITFIFLLFGMLYGIWHPLWIIYTTVPVYYSIAAAIDSYTRKKRSK